VDNGSRLKEQTMGHAAVAYAEFDGLAGRFHLSSEINSEDCFKGIVGKSKAIQQVLDQVSIVAPTDATVLLHGETGTGKELVARAIHNLSPRRDSPLVKINCAAISAGLVESELFGHVTGAFTGATERRIGRFEYANGGTIFLDEVSELPADSQAKLLRVLQEHEFEPVGSNRTIKVDVRVLAATNRDLTGAVKQGGFRADLYYRLAVVPVEVPPLRERREDIPALAAHFIERLGRQLGRRIERIPEDFMTGLRAYDWPGNIRELENFLAHAMILSRGELDASLLPYIPAPGTGSPLSLEEAERRHIEAVLTSTGWVVEGPKGAAGLLAMNPSTLRSRMKRLQVRRTR
jgi:formate hydrogenlyase transcriptional activator